MSDPIQFGRTLWREDDATFMLPDHVGFREAWKKLFDEEHDPARHTLISGAGTDEEVYRYDTGVMYVSSYPGNNAIYAAPAHIPPGRIRCLFVPVDGEPRAEFVTEVAADMLFGEWHLHRWTFHSRQHRIWSIKVPPYHKATGRHDREIHPSRKKVLGDHRFYPRGDFYVFGEDNGSIEEDPLAALLKDFRRAPEEVVMDKLREFHVANPFQCLKQRMALFDATAAWMKENP